MNILKNIILVIAATLLSVFFAEPAGEAYEKFFPTRGISSVDFASLIGLPLLFIFLIVILLTLFGGEKKYWWIGILLIPAIVFEVYFDLEHIYFPIILGIIGWLIAQVILKLKTQ